MIKTIEKCIDDVTLWIWMIDNKLKVNEEKTKALFCDPKIFALHLF